MATNAKTNYMTDEMRTMLASGELPAKVSNRMVLAMILDLGGKLDAGIEQNRMDHLCYQETVKIQKDFPSITWLFAHKPIKTIGVMLLVFTILMALYTAGAFKLFGVIFGTNLP
jgi:hypothetical protein